MTTSAAYEQIKAALDAIQARIESGELQEAESNALTAKADRLIEEIVWFAAPHTLAPTMHEAYGPGQLVADIDRPLLNLARLSDAHDKHDHGWGEELDKRLGGLSPGYILAVGASGAGFGKTAFVMQLADGLALQSVTDTSGPVTPVLILSEMPAYALTWRTLARWIGVDQGLLRGRPSGTDNDHADRQDAKSKVTAALAEGPFLEARKMIRVLGERAGSGPTAIERAEKVMAGWVAELRNEYPNRKIWPVLVIDPIQRFQDHGKGEVESLNELVEALGAVITRNQWCAFLTSDTNKPSRTGDYKEKRTDQQEGAAAFRGSYKLQHLADAVLYLRRPDESQPDIEAVLVKNRWGETGKDGDWPEFTFDGPKMRFKPKPQRREAPRR
ncbi:hypothetical protein KDL45_10965 [bacterium]|nr:hypothetical protein [bacterium]